MSDQVRLREALPADAVALAHLRYEFRSVLGEAVEERAVFIERAAAWFGERMTTDRWQAWLIERSDGEIIGHCFLQIVEKLPNPVEEAEWIGYITNVYVVPAERGRGHAGRMLDAALAYCRDRGAYSVILWPTDESRAMYERRGFVVPGRLMEMSCSTNTHYTRPISIEPRSA